jgi:hypothetical protein
VQAAASPSKRSVELRSSGWSARPRRRLQIVHEADAEVWGQRAPLRTAPADCYRHSTNRNGVAAEQASHDFHPLQWQSVAQYVEHFRVVEGVERLLDIQESRPCRLLPPSCCMISACSCVERPCTKPAWAREVGTDRRWHRQGAALHEVAGQPYTPRSRGTLPCLALFSSRLGLGKSFACWYLFCDEKPASTSMARPRRALP